MSCRKDSVEQPVKSALLTTYLGPAVQQVCLTLVSSNAFVKVQSQTWLIHLNTPETKFLGGECRTILQTKAAQTRQRVDNKSFKRQSLKGRTVCLLFSAPAGSPSPGMLPDKLGVIGLPRSRLQDPTSTSSFPAQLLPEVFLDCGLSTDLLPRVLYSHHRSQHILIHPFLSGVHKHLKSSEVVGPILPIMDLSPTWVCPLAHCWFSPEVDPFCKCSHISSIFERGPRETLSKWHRRNKGCAVKPETSVGDQSLIPWGTLESEKNTHLAATSPERRG